MNTNTGSRRPGYRWVVLGVCSVALIASSPGQTFVVALFNPRMQRTLGLSASAMSAAYMAATLLSAASLTLIGRAADWMGPRRAMSLAAVGQGLACGCMSQAEGLVSFTVGLLGLTVFGQGALTLTSGHALALWFERRLGAAEGVRLTLFSIGMAVVPVGVLAAIDTLGWRHAWLATGGAATLATLAVVLPFYRERPRDGDARDDGSACDGDAAGLRGVSLPDAMRTGLFWAVASSSMCGALIVTAVTFHLGAVADEQSIAFLIQVFAVASAVLFFGAGWVGDRLGPRVSLALGNVAMAAGCLALAAPGLQLGGMALLAVGSALLSTSVAPTLVKAFDRAHHGAIRGVVTTITVGGTAVGPVLLGLSIDYAQGTMPGLVGLALLALVIVTVTVVAIRD